MAIQSELKKEIEELPNEMQKKILNFVRFFKKEFLLAKKIQRKGKAMLAIDNIAIETGIDDLAAQHDHYIYGTQKK